MTPLPPMNPAERIQKTHAWLADQALPLWAERGVDWKQGGFVENLSLRGERLDGAKRTMVQARQISTFRTAVNLGVFSPEEGARMIEHSADFLTNFCFLPSGAIAHAVDRGGAVTNDQTDLYAQAFAIFGMANAFQTKPNPEYRQRARGVLQFLDRERRAPGGGYTETKDGGIQYQSNPHMHLFEAVLAWHDIDPDPQWRRYADEIFSLFHTKFIDMESGLLAEHFDERWRPLRNEGRFVFEPGHQFEWAWLLKWYERSTGVAVGAWAEQLFKNSETHGISRPRGSAYDEVWSDFTPKKKSARFWPQCERIKAAVRLGDAGAADEAIDVLFRYLEAPVNGLWYDTWFEDGKFLEQPVKASSLYHIIGGMSEYLRFRPQL